MNESSKTCSRCRQVKPFSAFSPDKRGPHGLASQCRTCNNSYHTARRAADPELVNSQARAADRRRRAADPGKSARKQRELHRQVRKVVLDHYGHACACCGRTTQLTIDHIDGSGAEHRKQFRWHYGFYFWLRDNGYPPGFQTLCQPCNRSKGISAYCRLSHARIPSGLGWPSDDGTTCHGSALLGNSVTRRWP